MPGPELPHGIDRGKCVAAGRVVLERHVADVECARIIERAREIRVVAHRRAEAARTLEDIERAGDAAFRGQGGHQSGLGGMARVHGLAHAVRAKRLLQSRGQRAGCGQRMRATFGIQAQHRRRRGRRAKGADRAGRVPEIVVGRLDDDADPGRQLIPGDHRAQEQVAVRVASLRDRERGADGRRARVIERIAIDIVELDRMRCATVDQRCRPRAGSAGRRE